MQITDGILSLFGSEAWARTRMSGVIATPSLQSLMDLVAIMIIISVFAYLKKQLMKPIEPKRGKPPGPYLPAMVCMLVIFIIFPSGLKTLVTLGQEHVPGLIIEILYVMIFAGMLTFFEKDLSKKEGWHMQGSEKAVYLWLINCLMLGFLVFMFMDRVREETGRYIFPFLFTNP